ncbi:hypothetical protein LX99_02985 [Mucilaginibacter oryzae]|uniref:Uncharacterized protein n=1 Tax=Mucilaginibacter oryzae TaxID=468058 RepID=A0A316HG09_9SPHI|nr:hypothetical protein [Mucilaginibacter oryzae]PWK77175.1 hypothetical protein LX99_02985 [Mucilaginibacter oryzae]
MKKLLTFSLAVLFTGIISSCKKEAVKNDLADIHSFTTGYKRDLGSAD